MIWTRLTLPAQFLFAGAIVMGTAMLVIGFWVASRIEQTVVQNSGISAALFMESFLSPLSQELAEEDTLSEPAQQALQEIFRGTALGKRVVSYRIWKPGNLVVYASNPDMVGKTFEPSDHLLTAWEGTISTSYRDLNDTENAAEAAMGIPLLEVYSPIREIWTGRVIAVAEFYERADQLASDITDARRKSWLIVATAFSASGLLLFGIVQAGGHTIRRQRAALEAQLIETQRISALNATLRGRAIFANRRATAEKEKAMRQVGFELHDGPAQYLALAALRLDSAFPPTETESKDTRNIRLSLAKALQEIRMISRGLALPDLDKLDLAALMDRAIDDHQNQTELVVNKAYDPAIDCDLDYSQKLCLYRFLQEALSNATRHAKATQVTVQITVSDTTLAVSVRDDGVGFDPNQSRIVHGDGGQGLGGLADRAEGIGGALDIRSAPGNGTTLTLTLNLERTLP